MASRSIKYIAPGKAKPLETSTGTIPLNLEPTQILVRLKATAINPADFKMIDEGQRVTTWPIVPGMDGAGVVEAVGSGVEDFVPGDRVMGHFDPRSEHGGSYQTHAVAQKSVLAKFPPSWSMEEAASLGTCYFTALVGLGIGLKMPLPFLKDGPRSGFSPSSVLILGGSSAVGASAIQLLRLVMPSCRILATSSPKHHSHLTETLGADVAIDRSSASLADEVKAETAGSRGVDAILDVVGAGAMQRNIFNALSPDGPRRYAQVWTGDDEIEAPDSVESILFRSRQLPELPGGMNALQALRMLMEEGKYRLPVPVHNVGAGLEGLTKGLNLIRKGVSGEKLVVTM